MLLRHLPYSGRPFYIAAAAADQFGRRWFSVRDVLVDCLLAGLYVELE